MMPALIARHEHATPRAERARRPARARRARASASTTSRASSRAASSSASPWRAPSCWRRARCSPTSRPATSIRPPAEGVQDLLMELNRERDITLRHRHPQRRLAGAMDRTLRLSAGRIAADAPATRPPSDHARCAGRWGCGGLLIGRRGSLRSRSRLVGAGGRGAGAARRAAAPGDAAHDRIAVVRIEGNARVDEEAIRVHIQSRAGQRLDRDDRRQRRPRHLRDGLLRRTSRSSVDRRSEGTGADLPGARAALDHRASRSRATRSSQRGGRGGAARSARTPSSTPRRCASGIADAKKLYEKKGYLDADDHARDRARARRRQRGRRSPTSSTRASSSASSEIEIEGNTAFSDRKLKRRHDDQREWILSRASPAPASSTREALKTDTERLTAYYYENGYIDVPRRRAQGRARRGRPLRHRQDRRGRAVQRSARSSSPATSAPTSTCAKDLDLADRARPSAEQAPRGHHQAHRPLRRRRLRLRQRRARDRRSTRTRRSSTSPTRSTSGPEVTIDRIEISGNTKTRDKVIRRELKVQEQERFSGTKLREEPRRAATGSASSRTSTSPPARPTARTSSTSGRRARKARPARFTAGAGFSSGDQFLLQRPHLGEQSLRPRPARRAQRRLRPHPAATSSPASPSRTLFDTPLIGDGRRVQLAARLRRLHPRRHRRRRLRVLYPLDGARATSSSSAAGLARGRPHRRRVPHRGRRDQRRQPPLAADASSHRGRTSLTSSIRPIISRNTLNSLFDPTRGSFQDFSIEFAGLGGESEFIKVEARDALVLAGLQVARRSAPSSTRIGGTFGYGIGFDGVSGDELPLFERYFPGGINSVRGFETRTLGPRETSSTAQGDEHQHAMPDRRQPAADRQQRDHLPDRRAARPEGRRLLRRRQRVPRTPTASTSATCATPSAAASAGCRRSGRSASSSAFPLNIEEGDRTSVDPVLVRRSARDRPTKRKDEGDDDMHSLSAAPVVAVALLACRRAGLAAADVQDRLSSICSAR